jgi:hypothetical protein
MRAFSGLLASLCLIGLGCRDEPKTPAPATQSQGEAQQGSAAGETPAAEYRSTRGRPGDPPPALMRLGAPNPMSASPKQIATFLSKQDRQTQSMTTFMYGEYCGWVLGLEKLVEIGAVVPRHIQTEFYDGAAHGYRPDSFETATLIAKIEGSIPEGSRRFFHDGVLRSYTESVKADPEKVVEFASDYANRVEGYGPFNGVRVGLQRAYGDDISGALTKAAEYPEDFQPAIFEELGWRVGDGQELGRIGSDGLAKMVPAASECVFAQGVARGYVLRSEMNGSVDWNAISAELTRYVEPICARGTWRGLGWAIELLSAHEPQEFSRRLSWMTNARQRAWAEEAMTASGQPGWELDLKQPE